MKRNKNFLEFIPEVNDKIEFYEKNELVYLKKKHNHIEPLYERLSQFIQILYNNDIVKLKKKSE